MDVRRTLSDIEHDHRGYCGPDVFVIIFFSLHLLQGIHCSCFAYGHTGSGKTYSMFGFGDRAISLDNQVELAGAPEGEGFGLVPRVCYHLLRRLKEGVDCLCHAPWLVSVSY